MNKKFQKIVVSILAIILAISMIASLVLYVFAYM